MIKFDEVTWENTQEHNIHWLQIPDNPYRIQIVDGSGSGKTNASVNLINRQTEIDKIFLYAKNPYELKYQYLINRCKEVSLKHLKDPKAFI